MHRTVMFLSLCKNSESIKTRIETTFLESVLASIFHVRIVNLLK